MYEYYLDTTELASCIACYLIFVYHFNLKSNKATFWYSYLINWNMKKITQKPMKILNVL